MRQLFIAGMLSLTSYCAVAGNSSNFNVNGTVTAGTCDIVINKGNSRLQLPNQTSTLPKGTTAGKTKFQLSIEGCTENGKNSLSVYFQNDQNTTNGDGQLANTADAASAAKNVVLQLLDHTETPINIGQGKYSQNPIPAHSANAGSATFDFYVQYYATGEVSAGEVTGSLIFLVEPS